MASSNENNSNDRLLDLVEESFDGKIDAAGIDELTGLVENDPQALAVYVQFVNLHYGLRQRCQTEAIEETGDGGSLNQDFKHVLLEGDSESRLSWKNYLTVLAASVLLSLGTLAYFILPTSNNNLSPSIETIAKAPVIDSENRKAEPTEKVAVLTRLVDVIWKDKITRWRPKQLLPRLPIEIESGLVQIEFYCGAVVIIEGPASFELLAPDRGFAHHGKLRAYVPTRAQGFVIETNSGSVVDLGTEFGLEIAPDGQSELHVLDGEVDFHSSDVESVGPHRLVGGQSMRIDQENLDPSLLDADSERFISPDELEARADWKSQVRYQRWLDYHDSLRADPSLVADYLFDDSHGWGRTLVNAAPSADPSSYGAIVGASWQRGRWDRSKALKFLSPSDRVRINLSGEFESLSLATWVYIQELLGDRNVALLHPEIDTNRDPELPKQRFIHWTLTRTPTGAVPHFAESVGHDNRNRNHYGPGRMGVYDKDVGHWVHLAVVYDRDAKLVSHYKDGEHVGSAKIDSPRILEIGTGDLCNWPYKGWAAGTQYEYRNLVGLMDEFIVLGRALSADEIREMHEIGRP